ncbi:hypothetical protein WDW89_07880 [Deltaproteobacteria bacterium TL4]
MKNQEETEWSEHDQRQLEKTLARLSKCRSYELKREAYDLVGLESIVNSIDIDEIARMQ